MAFLKGFAAGIIALIAYVIVLTVYPLVQMWWQVRRAGSGGIFDHVAALASAHIFRLAGSIRNAEKFALASRKAFQLASEK